ncbi:MAG: Mrp/NBP35 family ATP-binding protein [Prevotellaceae bacterium]|jgi:ATP-binding protein involved in chromosome partitioning|nr:Mrp/NBP35 family ATP-binding protein [Prevotellaceae bacterium]
MYNQDTVIEILTKIKHPESGKDIITVGVVEKVFIDGQTIRLSLLFKPNDAFVESVKRNIEEKLKENFPDANLNLTVVKKETAPAKKEYPPLDVRNIIAVASGKGGVGKSTVAVNIAVELARRGFKTGLLDADVHGPSIPTMLDMHNVTLEMVERQGLNYVEPQEKFGLKVISIGFLVAPDDAVIWRGPAASSMLRQFARETDWHGLDFLLIDLPPGTGDAHLTIVRELPLTAAVIVTTPQKVALDDVVRGISMFRNQSINVPIAGLVENMAWFTPAELPDNKYYIFGKDGGKNMAAKTGIPFLGSIPLIQSISEGGDEGKPAAAGNGATAICFRQIVDRMLEQPVIN